MVKGSLLRVGICGGLLLSGFAFVISSSTPTSMVSATVASRPSMLVAGTYLAGLLMIGVHALSTRRDPVDDIGPAPAPPTRVRATAYQKYANR